MESLDFSMPHVEDDELLSSGNGNGSGLNVTNVIGGVDMSNNGGNGNDNGNLNLNLANDYLSSTGSTNLLSIKKDLDNPYTPQHDSGHSSIESIEHQSSSQSSSSHSSSMSSSCRSCGRIEYGGNSSSSDPQSQSQQHYETIKLDELFTHVTSSPPLPLSNSPSITTSTSTTSSSTSLLRKSILQNGLCSTCIHHGKNKNNSCSNSPSRTSSIESPSSGIGMNNTVILKAESTTPSLSPFIKQELEMCDNNNDRIVSMIPSSTHIPTTIVNPNHHDTKMEVEIEGSGRCTVEVIPIPQELALQMMKNMSAANVATDPNFGSFHIIDPSHFQAQQDDGEHNMTYQHVQEEVVISNDGQHNMIFNNPGVVNPAAMYSTPSQNKSETLTSVSKTVPPIKTRKPRSFIFHPDKTYSTIDSISDTIDDVVSDCRRYAQNQQHGGQNFGLDDDEIPFDLTRNIKIEVTEQKYAVTRAPPIIPLMGPSNYNTSTPKSTYTSTSYSSSIKNKYKFNRNKILGPPPMINLFPSSSSSSSSLVVARKSAPPIIPLAPLLPSTTTSTPASAMFITNSTNSADKSVGCAACNKTFKNKRLCKAHYLRVHEKIKKYSCHICGLKFVYRGSLDSHLTTHKFTSAKYICEICSRGFKEKANLTQHLRIHQQGHRKYKCEFCSSSFSKRVNARYHMKRKHPDLYPTSNMYLSTYGANSGNSQQQNMIPTTSGVGPCGMIYGGSVQSTTGPLPSYNPQIYANMVPSHSNESDPLSGESDKKSEGNFKCEYCGRGFLFKNNLKAHLRTHTRDKKYTCNLCEKGFIYKESLKNHMLLHSNSFPYTCEICHKSFRDRSNRRKHVKNVHKHLLVNGEIPSSYQGSNAGAIGVASMGESSSDGSPKKRQVRTRRPKKTPASSSAGAEPDQYGNIPEFTTSPSTSALSSTKSAKNTKKSGKTQANKNISNPRNTNNNKSVIVSTNASSSTDLDRGIIMSSGGIKIESAMEYNFSDLPVTVHIPQMNIPGNQSQQQQQRFGRNVIVKASGGVTSTDTQQSVVTSRLPTDQHIYLSGGGTPMQQNVIVYPKPKASLLETYSNEVNQSVIAPNIQQYYSHGTASYESNISGAPYTHSIQSRLSPGNNSSTPPTFVETNYLPSTNRGRSNSLTDPSTISNSETNENVILQRGGAVQYSTSISAPPMYSSNDGSTTTEQPNNNAAQYQFWSQVQSSSGTQNVNNNSQTFYTTTSSSPSSQLLEGNTHISTTSNAITAPAYGHGTPEQVLVSTDPASTNNYYKDFDFSYFMNQPNA